MKIHQAYVSPSIAFFKPHFLAKYQLQEYHDPYRPAFFYGCYRAWDLEKVAAHKSLAVIIWAGSDVILDRNLALLSTHPRSRINPIHFIATSAYIADDMDALQVPYLRRNMVPISTDLFQPVPLGEKVYVYAGSKQREHIYGMQYLPAIREALPDIEFLVHYAVPPTVEHHEMPGVYAQSFIGLRLVSHDGCSCTVTEMGLMGRRCLWNGKLPNAIPWEDVPSVVAAIRQESARVGQVDTAVSEAVRAAVSETDWLDTACYGYEQRLFSFVGGLWT